MKKIDLSKTINTLANIGVVAGIVFLAIEINQNQLALEEQNTLTRLTGRDAAGEAFNGFRKLLLENPYLIPIWERGYAGEQLSSEEQAQFEYLCDYQVWMRFNLFVRLDALGLTLEAQMANDSLSDEVATSESFRRCWDRRRRVFLARGYERLVRAVDGGDAK